MSTSPDTTPTSGDPTNPWQQIPTKSTRMKDVRPPAPRKSR